MQSRKTERQDTGVAAAAEESNQAAESTSKAASKNTEWNELLRRLNEINTNYLLALQRSQVMLEKQLADASERFVQDLRQAQDDWTRRLIEAYQAYVQAINDLLSSTQQGQQAGEAYQRYLKSLERLYYDQGGTRQAAE